MTCSDFRGHLASGRGMAAGTSALGALPGTPPGPAPPCPSFCRQRNEPPGAGPGRDGPAVGRSVSVLKAGLFQTCGAWRGSPESCPCAPTRSGRCWGPSHGPRHPAPVGFQIVQTHAVHPGAEGGWWVGAGKEKTPPQQPLPAGPHPRTLTCSGARLVQPEGAGWCWARGQPRLSLPGL